MFLATSTAAADPSGAAQPQPQQATAQAELTARPQREPRTVERGGGIGRMFAWTTFAAGLGGGLASAGLVLYAKYDLDACEQNTFAGLGCADKQQQLDDATNVAVLGGIAGGGLLATSIVLFAVTDGKHTVIEYGDPPKPELPIGGYVATAVMLGGAITAHVMMSQAAAELRDPAAHATQDDTASLVSSYRYARYAAGGLYGLTAAFGVMSALHTVRVVRARDAEASTRLAVSPTRSGAMFSLAGNF